MFLKICGDLSDNLPGRVIYRVRSLSPGAARPMKMQLIIANYTLGSDVNCERMLLCYPVFFV